MGLFFNAVAWVCRWMPDVETDLYCVWCQSRRKFLRRRGDVAGLL